MKAFLLTAAAIVAAAGSMFAQNLPPDYNWEAGVNIGACGYTRPLGPATQYSGSSTSITGDFSVRVNHFFNEHWMLGADIGTRKWEAYGNWPQNGTMGQVLPNEQVSILVARQAINESFQFNYLIPFYSKYRNYNKANVFFGVMGGLVTTVNDGSIGYSTRKTSIDSGALYVSKYDYGFGIGFTYGVQMGFNYYFVPRFGVSVELAARYADVRTNNTSYNYLNSNFYLLYFPETIGLRYRF